MYYVYLLTCSDQKSYTGCTKDLKNRIKMHQKGKIKATKEDFQLFCWYILPFLTNIRHLTLKSISKAAQAEPSLKDISYTIFNPNQTNE